MDLLCTVLSHAERLTTWNSVQHVAIACGLQVLEPCTVHVRNTGFTLISDVLYHPWNLPTNKNVPRDLEKPLDSL